MSNVILTIDDGTNSSSLHFSQGCFLNIVTLLQKISGSEKRKGIDIVMYSIEKLVYFSELLNLTKVTNLTKSKDSANKVKMPKRKSPFSDDDKVVVAAWRAMYAVPNNVRLFYPAIKACLKNLRKDMDQEEILAALREAPNNALARKMGNPPPLSGLLSEKMFSHLVLQSELKKKAGGTGSEIDLRQYMNYMLFTQSANVPVKLLDTYVEKIKKCETKEQMSSVYKEYTDGSD